MPETVDEIEAAIGQATAPGFREQLLARGEARSMIWRDGVLPEDAPEFDQLLSYDLLSYGYSLLSLGLRLVEANGSRSLAQRAFEGAATAIESVIARGPNSRERGFHRVVAAAAYHLGGYSARAYSLLQTALDSGEVTIGERSLIHIIRRELDTLAALILSHRYEDAAADANLVETLRGLLEPTSDEDQADDSGDTDVVDVVDLALTDAFVGAISMALLAFERGEQALLDEALSTLQVGLGAAGELNMVPQWWCHRLAIHLLRGLWEASFHRLLPDAPTDGGGGDWAQLRATFIASLFRRRRSEIDLWPSQLAAAERVLNTSENLVLSLPTSAGKTRIAELCILACLAEGRRVVFVTPLRALSAQTETALQRTFTPLGKTVSSLYGAIGASSADEDLLRERDIVVATPEKLDFALRNDPTLLDSVGLVVLDEGHMIGADEREVRYEVQIQRLLRRGDAATRRIICLSAILPDGDEVEDFVNWLTDDQPDGLIASSWRPTKLRYGEVIWQGDRARLSIIVGDEEPFVPRFLEPLVPPIGRRKTPFPKNQQELTLATAWRLVDDGQTVLIFCPLKLSVNAFARVIVDLHTREALRSVFEGDPGDLASAITIGEEWFGRDHPILACLRLGVAIHHGSLPAPYRREVERLLQRGALKVTVSSPTLAQGLNLSASALVMHSLWRNRELIKASEFRNIVGRAGRAFVDSVGLVVHPIFKDVSRGRRNWGQLVKDTALRDMESGLLQLVANLFARMQAKHGLRDLDSLLEYVAGAAAWDYPEVAAESEEEAERSRFAWRSQLASLDNALLSLLNDSAIAEDGIEGALDDVLASSLWTRSLARRQEPVQTALRAGLTARARFLWSQSTPAQRRGYFLAGVGLETGRQLDEHASILEQHLRDADEGIRISDPGAAIDALTSFAGIAFDIYPFAPRTLPPQWEGILAAWLRGEDATQIAGEEVTDTLEFIEDSLAYRLPWALEAVRVRATAHEEPVNGLWAFLADEHGLAVASLETGTLNRSAALLMQAGFSSRAGALAAIAAGRGTFTTVSELHQWLNSEEVRQHANDPHWPTVSSHDLWVDFISRGAAAPERTWINTVEDAAVTWLPDHQPSSGTPYRAVSLANGETILQAADGRRAGSLEEPLNPKRRGLLIVTGTNAANSVELRYRGPSDLHA
ncbi:MULTISPECIES: DEAD/DEAH box helicase [Actinomycetes]|uniref:DEAD/DEAH box helicase n=5 Tax=Actinomycetes TaxID=1760 RepID=A0A3T0DG15_BREAU|nr:MULTISPECIES: DEAD/DEAH box helicase [Actinomycetes]AHI20849.1 superfamily II helicase-like protein [Corynebacterium casei LMG S-19264]AZT94245.1 DEAD/DEAH box helicase [Brevibacterium aurantiacum]KAB1946366.1 DEAD/DEAH box helicase [Brevibacterium linens ATCC 9172]